MAGLLAYIAIQFMLLISPFVAYFRAIQERREKHRESKELKEKADMMDFFKRRRGVYRFHVVSANIWVRATYSVPKASSSSSIERVSILTEHIPVVRRLDARRQRYRFRPEMCRLEIKGSNPKSVVTELPITLKELQSKMGQLAREYRSRIESQKRFEGKLANKALQDQRVGANAEENQREAGLVSDAAQTDEKKRFKGAEEKLAEAGSSFDKEDYTSTMNNLNTALELRSKELLEIPLTMTKITTANIIEIWVARKYLHFLYMSEARKHALDIDNKIKHEGYTPTRRDCIDGMRSIHDLFEKLKGFELTDEMRTKLYEGLRIR
jgi:hypothetical protein